MSGYPNDGQNYQEGEYEEEYVQEDDQGNVQGEYQDNGGNGQASQAQGDGYGQRTDTSGDVQDGWSTPVADTAGDAPNKTEVDDFWFDMPLSNGWPDEDQPLQPGTWPAIVTFTKVKKDEDQQGNVRGDGKLLGIVFGIEQENGKRKVWIDISQSRHPERWNRFMAAACPEILQAGREGKKINFTSWHAKGRNLYVVVDYGRGKWGIDGETPKLSINQFLPINEEPQQNESGFGDPQHQQRRQPQQNRQPQGRQPQQQRGGGGQRRPLQGQGGRQPQRGAGGGQRRPQPQGQGYGNRQPQGGGQRRPPQGQGGRQPQRGGGGGQRQGYGQTYGNQGHDDQGYVAEPEQDMAGAMGVDPSDMPF